MSGTGEGLFGVKTNQKDNPFAIAACSTSNKPATSIFGGSGSTSQKPGGLFSDKQNTKVEKKEDEKPSLFSFGDSKKDEPEATDRSHDDNYKLANPAPISSSLFASSLSNPPPFPASKPATTSGLFGPSSVSGASGLFGSTAPANPTGLFASSKSPLLDNKGEGLFGSNKPATLNIFEKKPENPVTSSSIDEKPSDAKVEGDPNNPYTNSIATSGFFGGPKKVESAFFGGQSLAASTPIEMPVKRVEAHLFDSQIFDTEPATDQGYKRSVTFGDKKALIGSQVSEDQDKKQESWRGANEVKSPGESIVFQRIESSKLAADQPVLTSSVMQPVTSKPEITSCFGFGDKSKAESGIDKSGGFNIGMSSIIAPSTGTSAGIGGQRGLFASVFPKVEEKKEEKLQLLVKPELPNPPQETIVKSKVSEPEKTEGKPSELEPRRIESSLSMDGVNALSSLSLNRNIVQTSLVPPANQPEESGKDAAVVQEIKKPVLPRMKREEVDRDAFVLPQNFPQLLLTCRWSDKTLPILSEVFGISEFERNDDNKKALKCLYKETRPAVTSKKENSLNHASLMRGLFESSVSLFLSLNSENTKPVSVVGPVVAGLKPGQALQMTSKVMHSWAAEIFNFEEGPKLLWENGSQRRVIDLEDQVETQTDETENEQAAALWESDTISPESRYFDHLQTIEVNITKTPVKTFSIAFRWGTNEILGSLYTRTRKVTADTVKQLFEAKGVKIETYLESVANRTTDIVKDLQQSQECKRLLNSPGFKNVVDLNTNSYEFRLARDSDSYYIETLTLYPVDQDISELPSDGYLNLQLVAWNQRKQSTFVKVVVKKSSGQTLLSQVIAIPKTESQGKDAVTLEDVMSYAKIQVLLDSSSDTTTVASMFQAQVPSVRFNGRLIEASSFETSVKEIFGESYEDEKINFLEFSLKTELNPTEPVSKSVKLEALPSVTKQDLEKGNDADSVFVTFNKEPSTENDFEISLPANIGDYLRVSAFEPSYGRAISRVKKDNVWTEIDYNPIRVTWRSPEAVAAPAVGKWSCAMYQKKGFYNTEYND